MPLSRREQRFVAVGGLVAVLGLGYLLWPSGSANVSGVEVVPADQRPEAAALAPPPPAQPVAVQAAAAAASGVPDGVRLTGVMGRGATFVFPDNAQRYVPVGGTLAPGLTLQAVRVDGVLLASGASTWRLGFGGSAVAVGAAPGAPIAAAPRGATAATQAYVQAMEPVRTGERITGFTVRPGANLPALQQAGIQPGDTIVGVNGAEFSPEQLQELSWTIANATRTEFDVIRGGRRMRLAIEGRR